MRKAADCVTKAVKAKKQCEQKTNLLVYKKEQGKQDKCCSRKKQKYVATRKYKHTQSIKNLQPVNL